MVEEGIFMFCDEKEFEITYTDSNGKEIEKTITINMEKYGEEVYGEEIIHPSSNSEFNERKKEFIMDNINSELKSDLKKKNIDGFKELVKEVDESFKEYTDEMYGDEEEDD